MRSARVCFPPLRSKGWAELTRGARPRGRALFPPINLLARGGDFPRRPATRDEAFPFLLDMAFFADDFLRCWARAVMPTDVPTKIVRMIKNKRVTKTQRCFLMFQSLSWPNLYGPDTVLMWFQCRQ